MSKKVTDTAVPKGYTIAAGPGSVQCLVPQFMVPSLDHSFSSYSAKVDVGVLQATGLDPYKETIPEYSTLGGRLHVPPDPPLTDQERLSLHAEVCALQEKLGISYKDAAHRLYIAEIEKLKIADIYKKSSVSFDKRITTSLRSLTDRHTVYVKAENKKS